MNRKLSRLALCMTIAASMTGCSYFVSSATHDIGHQLKQTLLDQDDPETVAAALPAYLIMVESLANQNDSARLFLSGAQLYSAYLTLLPDDDGRKIRLSNKALTMAERGACASNDMLCDLRNTPITELDHKIASTDPNDIDSLYTVGAAWAAWIQANKNDWNAIAQLAHVKHLMRRVLELDEHFQNGNPHLYLAVLESLAPPALGGKPELAKQHFDRAMALAPENLFAPVLYAKHYARMIFDRELHDTLLKNALAKPVAAPGMTLINTLAQQQARQLLESANHYF